MWLQIQFLSQDQVLHLKFCGLTSFILMWTYVVMSIPRYLVHKKCVYKNVAYGYTYLCQSSRA